MEYSADFAVEASDVQNQRESRFRCVPTEISLRTADGDRLAAIIGIIRRGLCRL